MARAGVAWAGGEEATPRVRVRIRVTRVTRVTRVGVRVGVAGSRTGGGPGRRPGLARTRASTRPPSGTTTGRTRRGRRWTAPRRRRRREGGGGGERVGGGEGPREPVGREVRGWGGGRDGRGRGDGARRGARGEFIGEEMRGVSLVTFVSSSSSGVGFLSGGGREPFSSTRGLPPGEPREALGKHIRMRKEQAAASCPAAALPTGRAAAAVLERLARVHKGAPFSALTQCQKFQSARRSRPEILPRRSVST